MKPQPHDLSWLDASETVSLSDLSRACAISDQEVTELVEYGALKPLDTLPSGHVFSAASVPAMRTACQVRRDYDLELFTVALFVRYLNRIEELERELRAVQAQLPSHATKVHRDGPQPWHESHATAGDK